MRIIVFSDSHNNFYALKTIMRIHKNADYYFHLGDGERDFLELSAAYPDKRLLHVCGNCDWASTGEDQRFLMLEGRRILLTHGHKHYVKSGPERLIAYARSLGADIVMHGHTHIAHTVYEDGLYLMNPGSVTSPRGGKPSYGIADITGAGVALNIAYL